MLAASVGAAWSAARVLFAVGYTRGGPGGRAQYVFSFSSLPPFPPFRFLSPFSFSPHLFMTLGYLANALRDQWREAWYAVRHDSQAHGWLCCSGVCVWLVSGELVRLGLGWSVSRMEGWATLSSAPVCTYYIECVVKTGTFVLAVSNFSFFRSQVAVAAASALFRVHILC